MFLFEPGKKILKKINILIFFGIITSSYANSAERNTSLNIPSCSSNNLKQDVISGVASFFDAMASEKKPEYFNYQKQVNGDLKNFNVTLLSSEPISQKDLSKENNNKDMDKIDSKGQPVFRQHYLIDDKKYFKAVAEFYSYCETDKNKPLTQSLNDIGDIYLLAK